MANNTGQSISYSANSIRWGRGYTEPNNQRNLMIIEDWLNSNVGKGARLRQITGVIKDNLGRWQPYQQNATENIFIANIPANSILTIVAQIGSIDTNAINAIDLDTENNFLVVHADYIVPVYMREEDKSYSIEVPRKFILTLTN